MDQKDKEQIKIKIEEAIEGTNEAIVELEEMTKPISPENAIGRISRMDAINNKSVAEAALRQAKEKLNGLKMMLDKIDDANFGKCIQCKAEIPIARLLYMPSSRKCVKCAR